MVLGTQIAHRFTQIYLNCWRYVSFASELLFRTFWDLKKNKTNNNRKVSSGSVSASQSCQSVGLSERLIHRGNTAWTFHQERPTSQSHFLFSTGWLTLTFLVFCFFFFAICKMRMTVVLLPKEIVRFDLFRIMCTSTIVWWIKVAVLKESITYLEVWQ